MVIGCCLQVGHRHHVVSWFHSRASLLTDTHYKWNARVPIWQTRGILGLVSQFLQAEQLMVSDWVLSAEGGCLCKGRCKYRNGSVYRDRSVNFCGIEYKVRFMYRNGVQWMKKYEPGCVAIYRCNGRVHSCAGICKERFTLYGNGSDMNSDSGAAYKGGLRLTFVAGERRC